jgi:tetratricopeptide (TPR) repeat protein
VTQATGTTEPAGRQESLIDSPPAGEPDDGLSRGTAVRYFGDYEIRRALGRGGMGVVYEAHQASLNRPVALKLVKAGLLAGDDELRRFRNEAEAVARLDHPGIVPIYEVGEHDGQHYFSMKLISGGSLVPLLDRYRDDLRAAARLAAAAAEAVAHAHVRGILHRDLKPANILVDAEGRPHVTDFGLAKRVEADVEFTQSGAILGTPAYMSPEQAGGRSGSITTATDVYGLGALLYALLTGRAPFGGDSVLETIDAVRNVPPEAPRKLNAAVPRDLETICLKGLEKDPRRRYATAQALADDLHAWLELRPIAARRVGVLERAWLWCKRHPAVAALSAAVVLATVGGTATVIAVQAGANAQLRAANRRVEQRYELAVEAIRTFHTGVSEDFLLKQDQFKELRDRLLKSASDFYTKLAVLLGRETGLDSRRALATSNFELANLISRIGRPEEALAAHRAVLATREVLAAEAGAGAGATTAIGRSLTAIAALLEATGKTGEAVEVYRRSEALLAGPAGADLSARAARAVCRMRLGRLLASTGKTAEALVAYREARADQEGEAASAGASNEARRDLADTVGSIADLLSDTGDHPGAEVEYRAVMKIYRELAEDRPAVAEFRNGLASTHHNLGWLLTDTGRPSEAEAELRHALALWRKLLDDLPAVAEFRSRLANSHTTLAILLDRTGRSSEADAEFRYALALWRELVDDFPGVAEFRSRLGGAHHNLAMKLAGASKPMEAEAEYRRAIAVSREATEKNPATTRPRLFLANHHHSLGDLLAATGKPEAAEVEYRQALAIRRNLVEDNPAVTEFRYRLAISHNSLGSLLLDTGRPAAAEAEYRQALAIWRKLAEENPTVTDFRSGLAGSKHNFANVLERRGKLTEAEAEYRRAIAISQEATEKNPAFTEYRVFLANHHHSLGDLLSVKGRPESAEVEYREALAIRRKLAAENTSDPSHLVLAADVENSLANMLRHVGRASEALRHADRAVADRESLVKQHAGEPSYRSGLAEGCRCRGLARRALGDADGAAADLRRAVGLYDALPSRTPEQCYFSACAHAALAGLGDRSRSGKLTALVTSEADAAMALLHQAVAAGYHNPAYPIEDALDSLRHRPDFRLLMMDLAFPAEPFAELRY